jgi:hypothetical protein
MIAVTWFILVLALSSLLPPRGRKIELIIGFVSALASLFLMPSAPDSGLGLLVAAGFLTLSGAAAIVIAASYVRSKFVSGNAHG